MAHRDFRPGGTPTGGIYAEVNPYPAARTNRGRGITLNNSQPAVAGLPNVRIWTYSLETSAANRQSRSASLRFVGPIYIDEIAYTNLAIGRATPLAEFYCYYQPTTYTTFVNSVDITRPPGTPLVEHTQGGSPEDTAKISESLTATMLVTTGHVRWKIGKLIQMPEIFLAVGLISRQAGAFPVYGSVRVLENIDLQIAGELLAG